MECPSPQPGHQVIPSILSGHSEKWDALPGFVNASEVNAATQNASSKYLRNAILINLIGFAGQQYRYSETE